MHELTDIDFEDFFEPEEDNVEDFNFIDPSILQQFSSTSISIEKIQKEIFNFDEKGDDDYRSERAMRNFEFQIQVNRVLQIFDEMVKKIETLLCVQEFVKDHALMEKYFNEHDIEDLSKYCSSYYADMDLDDSEETENVSKLIRLLLNTDLHKYSEKYSGDISLQKKLFMSSIKELRNIIYSRLQLTAPKELKKEQVLHQMWKKYEKTKEKIATLREKWIYRKENFEEKMQNKYETIERYKKEIEILKRQSEIEIHDQIKQSNVDIINFCKVKDTAIEEKYNNADDAKESYKQLLNENLANEKKLRERKDKAIQSLQAILHKYDVEVGEERTRELEELRAALELQRKEFAVWKETIYEPQIVLHAQLMHEKAEIERREIAERMLIFMMNRSARILQKYWRVFTSKRKKKKGRRYKKK